MIYFIYHCYTLYLHKTNKTPAKKKYSHDFLMFLYFTVSNKLQFLKYFVIYANFLYYSKLNTKQGRRYFRFLYLCIFIQLFYSILNSRTSYGIGLIILRLYLNSTYLISYFSIPCFFSLLYICLIELFLAFDWLKNVFFYFPCCVFV